MPAFEHYLFGRFEARDEPLSVDDVAAICREARERQRRLEELPQKRVLAMLDAVGKRWRDPSYEGRQAAVKHMPRVVGFSPEMVEAAIDALCDTLERKKNERRLQLELGGSLALDGWRFVPRYDGYVRAQALGTVLHVSAGNVFVSGVDSLVSGILTRNAGLLKVSRADPLFPHLFARSLCEVDAGGALASSFAILSFRGGETDIETALKQNVDGIVVWGGAEAVASWRADVPLAVRLVPHGPKASFAVITSQGLLSSNLADVAAAAARDVVLWEGRACASPHVLYVEAHDGGIMLDLFTDALTEALTAVAKTLPPAKLSFDEQVELLRHRELARMSQALGEGEVLMSAGSQDWTVVKRMDPGFHTGPGNRTVYVQGFEHWEDVLAEATRHRGDLLGCGVLGLPREIERIASDLVRAGVDRISELGKMALGKVGSPHEGTFALADLVRWVCIESVAQRFDLGEFLAPPGDQVKKWARLQDLLVFAKEHSPFYRRRLGDRSFEEYEEFEKIPFLDRTDVYRHTPPQGEGLLTGPLEGAYVFASGGSTGEPKFSFYSYDEFSHVTTLLSEIYQVAGLRHDDVVGNLFMAGNLWTSFMVANEALEKIGCVTLPIAGNADIDLIIRYLQLFRPTALLGLPSIMIQLAETVRARGYDDIKVRLILYGGEHIGEEAKALLRRVLGCETIVSAGYASVDAGPVGYQCLQAPRTVHHLLFDYQFLEIVDPDTGDVLPRGATGEIIVTNLNRRLMPIVRFRTGDLGRRVEGVCACGRAGPSFELLGRADDVLRVGSVSIYPEEIQAALAETEGVSHLFQVVADFDGTRDSLLIRAEVPIGAVPPGNGHLSGELRERILSRNGELAEAVREGWLAGFAVEVLPAGGIPRIKRTGKIRKVVDRRTEHN